MQLKLQFPLELHMPNTLLHAKQQRLLWYVVSLVLLIGNTSQNSFQDMQEFVVSKGTPSDLNIEFKVEGTLKFKSHLVARGWTLID
jgi:hypothetical protein